MAAAGRDGLLRRLGELGGDDGGRPVHGAGGGQIGARVLRDRGLQAPLAGAALLQAQGVELLVQRRRLLAVDAVQVLPVTRRAST